MTEPCIPPVTFGAAGVIHTAGTRSGQEDDGWIDRAFRMTPMTARTTWTGDCVLVRTYQHAHEARVAPGNHTGRFSSASGVEGLVAGRLFGARADDAAATARLLQTYQQLGIRAFLELNGSWIAVLWERDRQRAVFLRDSLGTQALYAARLSDRIVFTTDLRVFQINGWFPERDEQAFAEYLRFLYVPPPRTLYRDVAAVLAGHALTVEGPSVVHEQYTPPRFVDGPTRPNPNLQRDMEAYLPEFEEKLLAAVSDCLPPAGRVALGLSGGQDSSTLAIALSKLCPERTIAFTLGRDNETYSEGRDAVLVARHLRLTHQCYSPTPADCASLLTPFVREQDQPIGDPAAFPYFFGLTQLPEDCTIVLDGSGNDDYFGVTGSAYALKYKVRRKVQRFVPEPLWPLLLRAMTFGPKGFQRLSKIWSKPVEESFVPWEGWNTHELSALFRRRVSLEETHLYKMMRKGTPDEWKLLMTEAMGRIWEPQAGFAKGVHFAHAAGKGLLFPFIDERFAAFVHQLPMEMKLDKMILRAYMAKHLPSEIVDKPKSGFLFDLNRLLDNPQYAWADDLKAHGLLRVLPLWADEPVGQLLQFHANEPGDLRWQHRLYGLCLLASVVASKNGRFTPSAAPLS